jgi:2,4-diketo-3-deoxy-L-fuconate hydrolase
VVGVTAGQDISDRPVQFAAKPPHFDLAKSFDTFGPLGPVVVSTDQLIGRDALRVTCEINGETRQDGTTADLIFDVPTLISYLSSITTLTTGDLIFTGTPDGVGAAQGKFLADGDIITTTIDGIGTMTNRVVRISDPRPIGG